MTKAYVNFGHNATNFPSSPWNNHLFPDPTVVAQISADLLDDASSSTGWTLDITTAFGPISGSTSTATGGAGDWQQEVFDFCFRTGNGVAGAVTIGGLTSGDDYTIEVAGYNANSRDTQFTVNGVSADYTFTADAANPAAPLTFTGTVPVSGELEISAIVATTGSFYGHLNGFTIETTPAAPSYTITSIDGDNNVQAGQSNVSIVTSGIDPASVTQAVTLGGETLTINSWTDSGGNALINVDIPLHIDLEWGTTHELAVTHDGGTTTLSGVTLSAPTGWETVSFATIPDTGTTESFYEYSQSDVTVGNFTAQVGDTLAFTSSTGLTIDGSSIPVVNPAATVTGSYKWWDASLSTWTPVSSYTITNLGVFGGGDTTVMIQEMISDMISEMVN